MHDQWALAWRRDQDPVLFVELDAGFAAAQELLNKVATGFPQPSPLLLRQIEHLLKDSLCAIVDGHDLPFGA